MNKKSESVVVCSRPGECMSACSSQREAYKGSDKHTTSHVYQLWTSQAMTRTKISTHFKSAIFSDLSFMPPMTSFSAVNAPKIIMISNFIMKKKFAEKCKEFSREDYERGIKHRGLTKNYTIRNRFLDFTR